MASKQCAALRSTAQRAGIVDRINICACKYSEVDTLQKPKAVKFRIDKAVQEEDALDNTPGFKRWKLKYCYLLSWNVDEPVAE
ncbi:hypothetical protein J6590_057254 [Homalodisca vitripennis]|nr:hypothetical protein J6590_057254 [Homalodisca vitripennis]